MKHVKKFTLREWFGIRLLWVLVLTVFSVTDTLSQASAFSQYDNTGPYQTVTSRNDGPSNNYAIYRPASLGANGERHPIITWGNGTGASPETYAGLCRHLASYGFVVIA